MDTVYRIEGGALIGCQTGDKRLVIPAGESAPQLSRRSLRIPIIPGLFPWRSPDREVFSWK